MDITELLGEDLAKQVNDKLGDNKLFIGKDGEFIPKGRFDEVNTQLKDFKKQVADRDEQIAKLQEGAKGNEALEAKIKELTEANAKAAKDYEDKIAAREREYLIEGELNKSNAKSTKALRGLIDFEKVNVKEGKLEGLSDQIEAIRKSDAYLFNDIVPGKVGIEPGKTPGKTEETKPDIGSVKSWNRHKYI